MAPLTQNRYRNLLASQGHDRAYLTLPTSIQNQVLSRDWEKLDQAMRGATLPGGLIFEELRKYEDFSEIEFIISIRSSILELDEDGIWHDDGSRVLAFSLSLTLDPSGLEGGTLEIRKRDASSRGESISLPTPPFGTLIIFATGHLGFEHKINRVVRGERIIIAGWCT